MVVQPPHFRQRALIIFRMGFGTFQFKEPFVNCRENTALILQDAMVLFIKQTLSNPAVFFPICRSVVSHDHKLTEPLQDAVQVS